MGFWNRTKHTSAVLAPELGPAHVVDLAKDTNGAPAVDLAKIEHDGYVDLAKNAREAGVSLEKAGLAGIRAQVILVLDHSSSMRTDYHQGKVQRLVERFLAFALQVDADGVVPVIPFDSRVHDPILVGVRDNPDEDVVSYKNVVDKHIWHNGRMGSTRLDLALAEVRRRWLAYTDMQMLIGVATDGQPDFEDATTDEVCELSRYAGLLKFLALRPVPYLDKLDNLERYRPGKRLIDNVNSQPQPDSRLNLLTCTNPEFQDAMVAEWATWMGAAQAAGVLR